jgi:2'-hydroxyisoflavone reductase
MNILVIGGKRFVGYHIVTEALKKGHNVTFFNRGKTNPELFLECETVIGDRNKDMEKLVGYEFDVVIDTCAYFPSQVSKALDVLEGHFKRYLLISSLSVVTPKEIDYDESVETHKPNYTATEITGETYGPLKVACEEVLQQRLGNQAIIIRPGYIVGDKDYTYRFSYVPILMHYLDEILVPETTNLRYTFIDGKDLAQFVIHSLESEFSGIFHVVGPDNFYYNQYIEICQQVVNPHCKLVYKDHQWFESNNIVKPVAFPTCNDFEEGRILFAANTTKAQQHGLTLRPVESSIKDGLEYYIKTVGTLEDLQVGMNIKDMQRYMDETD